VQPGKEKVKGENMDRLISSNTKGDKERNRERGGREHIHNTATVFTAFQ
jgi:hypothetical protein